MARRWKQFPMTRIKGEPMPDAVGSAPGIQGAKSSISRDNPLFSKETVTPYKSGSPAVKENPGNPMRLQDQSSALNRVGFPVVKHYVQQRMTAKYGTKK